MKKSDIEKRLKQDLQAATPFDFNAVKNRCCFDQDEMGQQEGDTLIIGKRKGVWLRITAVFLVCITAVAVFLYAWGKREKQDFGLTMQAGYFILDINPSVEIAYDEHGEVTATTGLNEDGEVLLYGVELIGKNYKDAAETLFVQCVALGYFSSERTDNAMLVSAMQSADERDEEMTAQCKEIFSQALWV